MTEAPSPALRRSVDVGQIALALAKAQGEFKEIKKNQEATIKTTKGYTYAFRYADLQAIKDGTQEALTKNELAVTHLPNGQTLHSMLIHSSGEYFEAILPITYNGDIKATGSALTYFKRYNISALLNISVDDDDDGSAHNGDQYRNAGNDAPRAENGQQPPPRPQRDEPAFHPMFNIDGSPLDPQPAIEWEKHFVDYIQDGKIDRPERLGFLQANFHVAEKVIRGRQLDRQLADSGFNSYEYRPEKTPPEDFVEHAKNAFPAMSEDEIRRWIEENKRWLNVLKKYYPDLYDEVVSAKDARKAALTGAMAAE